MSQSADVALIQYIGKQPRKTDSVRPGSGRVWDGPGAVLPIPAIEKLSYLAHRSVWIEVTEEQLKAQRREADEESVAEICESIKGLSLNAMTKISAFLDTEIRLAQVQEEAKRPAPTVEKTAAPNIATSDVITGGDEASLQAFQARITAVSNVIRDLDLKDDRIAVNGWPTPEAIQGQTGQLPTINEIIEAMRLLGHDVDGNPPPAALTGAEPEESEADPQKGAELRERAQMALAEIDDANETTVKEMADAFDIKIHPRAGEAKARETVRDGLKAIATGESQQPAA